jgi:hypothetical protein
MVKYRFWVTTSLESATSLQSQNTGEGLGDNECIAALFYRHMDEMWGAGNIFPALEMAIAYLKSISSISRVPKGNTMFSSDAATISKNRQTASWVR